MSWQATAWVDSLPYDVTGPLAFRVLVKLANVADAQGRRAWRNKAEIALELGVSQRSVQRAFRELEYAALIFSGDQELVRHIRADRRPTVYDLNLARAVEPTAPIALDGLDGETTTVTPPRGDRVIHNLPRGDTPGANGETTVVAHRTIQELVKSPTQVSPVRARRKEDQRCASWRRNGQHQPDSVNSHYCTSCGHPLDDQGRPVISNAEALA